MTAGSAAPAAPARRTDPAVRPLRLGARTSPLARAQVDIVEARLAAAGVETAFVGVTTTGDVDRRELTEIGGTGVFAGAVRDALRHGTVDVAFEPGPRTLSLRLRALEDEGIVARQTFGEVPPRVEYALTPKGEALLPIIEDMRSYGARWLGGECGAQDDAPVVVAAALA